MKIISTCVSAGAAALFAVSGVAVADNESEDLSAAYEADLDRIAGERGLADPASTFNQSADGVLSAVVGVSKMKFLAVRRNDDGSLSYEHVESGDEFEEFATADPATQATEE